ncbi:MAG: ABC transporter permease [Hyphomicrobiales bacterium]|nr:ABC transporter permease [Hyphomicrobiales bacterium]
MNRIVPVDWMVALRFLKEGRMQTLFILGGIAIGVAVIVFMSAMLAGLEQNFIKRVLTSQAHIQLLPPDQVARPLRFASGIHADPIIQRPSQRIRSVDQWQKVTDAARSMEEVAVVSPNASGSALLTRGDASRSVSMTGVVPETYFLVVRLPDYIVDGQPRLTSEDILIGTDLARDIGAVVGDKVNVTAASGARRTLTITGLLDFGNKGANMRAAFVALRTAQSLIGMVGGVTSIDVTVRDIYAAETVAQRIAAEHPVQADSWIKTNAQFFSAMRAQIATNTLIRVFVGLSVAFGIAAVLIVSVIQRSKDIGILRAMGARRGQLMRVFLIQGGLLGFAGSLIGAAMGLGALVYWHSIARQADGKELFPLVLDASLVASAAVMATAVGVLAAAMPAVRAARLDPVVAIRG